MADSVLKQLSGDDNGKHIHALLKMTSANSPTAAGADDGEVSVAGRRDPAEYLQTLFSLLPAIQGGPEAGIIQLMKSVVVKALLGLEV